MKYIIMCSGNYLDFKIPKQMCEVCGEPIVARTIRLLRENGVDDIAISSNHEIFKQFDVEFIEVKTPHTLDKYGGKGYLEGHWLNGFVEIDGPVCYIFGDVVFSENAIKTIVKTETNDIEFFASAEPFDKDYPVPWAEPFAFKVVNMKHFRDSIQKALEYKHWLREPVSWELWQVIKNTPYNQIIYTNYTKINDFTCDIDHLEDVEHFNEVLSRRK